MKIQGSAGAGAASASPRSGGQDSAGFEPTVTSSRDAAPAGPASAVNTVSSLDALLALQETPGPMERRRRAVKRAGRLLDILDSVKLSLLDGGNPAAMLNDLKGAVGQARGETDDPRLEGVLDEIETRAAVELAKQEMAKAIHARAA